MYSMFSQTISAISTPRGSGGIAVIRISGDEAISIADKFIKAKNGKVMSEIKSNLAFTADIIDDKGDVIDSGIVTIFRSPRSFTGEDTVEISCHGGILVSSQVLARSLECGAVQAGPGEFTRRAFASGKLSLSQAEAIGELISAKSYAALRLARINVDGALKAKTNEIYDEIKSILSAVYAGIDFPDEELSPLTKDEMRQLTAEVLEKLEKLKTSYKTGHAVVEGIKTVICGKPNTGKSTLLNLLCGKQRAIVTDIAGTTRDVITEQVVCGNASLLISDTAGIHNTFDTVEKFGVERSVQEIEDCELIIAVFDSSAPFDEDDEKIISIVKNQKQAGATTIGVMNKADKCANPDTNRLNGIFDKILIISAKEDASYGVMESAISELFSCGMIGENDGATLTSARQYARVCATAERVKEALTALDTAGEDFAGAELEAAMGVLGEVDGRKVGIEIVDEIFEKFCVGK
ncbi:MAG: tRNA uridine-5-carboxymethylaminomethyl(34) synthesis GTPase MnmE [Clostridia bacterium]|nr:tRNA uridine-5-carboxymethylaminomethyl(34) synthesis GTPase MnmE [Clostridia bacterium]